MEFGLVGYGSRPVVLPMRPVRPGNSIHTGLGCYGGPAGIDPELSASFSNIALFAYFCSDGDSLRTGGIAVHGLQLSEQETAHQLDRRNIHVCMSIRPTYCRPVPESMSTSTELPWQPGQGVDANQIGWHSGIPSCTGGIRMASICISSVGPGLGVTLIPTVCLPWSSNVGERDMNDNRSVITAGDGRHGCDGASSLLAGCLFGKRNDIPSVSACACTS